MTGAVCRRSATALAVLGLTVTLTGCGSGTVVPSSSLGEAKKIATAHRDQVVDRIPDDEVVSVEAHEEGRLWSCDDDRTYRWNAPTHVVLMLHDGRPRDARPWFDDLAGEYEQEQAWTVDRGDPRQRDLDLSLRGPGSEAIFIGTVLGGRQVVVDSWSPCFPLDRVHDPFATY